LGRGRILGRFSAKPSAVSRRRSSQTIEHVAGYSLSLRERVRVRGIVLPFDTTGDFLTR